MGACRRGRQLFLEGLMMQLDCEPRPTVEGPEFFLMMARGLVQDIMVAISAEWNADQKEKASAVIAAVLPQSDDGFVRAALLKEKHQWDVVNEKVVSILRGSFAQNDSILADLESVWAMKTGVRFPAKEGQMVNFRMAPNAPLLRGLVLGVFKARATALVRWTPSSGSPVDYKVAAEQVESVMGEDQKTVTVATHVYAGRVRRGEIAHTHQDAMKAMLDRKEEKEKEANSVA